MKPLHLSKLGKSIGLTFRKDKLIQAALTHPSYQNASSEPLLANFQRLEFLGDAILNAYIAKKLYHLFPEANEGVLSRLRSILVSRKLLARIAKKIKLSQYLLLGSTEKKQLSFAKDKLWADCLEALIAAIYFDCGQKKTEAFLERYFGPYLNQKKLFLLDPNPKSTLQELVQKEFHILPSYENAQKRKNQFHVWVSVNGKMRSKGIGSTIREAEANAAAILLIKLKATKRPKASARKELVPKS